MSKATIQCSRKTFAKCVHDVIDVEIVRVRIEYLSVILTKYWFPFSASGCGSKISMATKSSGSAARKSWRRFLCLSLLWFIARLTHLATCS